jgi:hypothetical protein
MATNGRMLISFGADAMSGDASIIGTGLIDSVHEIHGLRLAAGQRLHRRDRTNIGSMPVRRDIVSTWSPPTGSQPCTHVKITMTADRHEDGVAMSNTVGRMSEREGCCSAGAARTLGVEMTDSCAYEIDPATPRVVSFEIARGISQHGHWQPRVQRVALAS